MQAAADFAARYSRQLQLPGFGAEAQRRLAAASVLVVGAGGLGVPALQYLAGMGIGGIGVVDDDDISLSNLHRQVMYTTAEIGQPKVAVAALRLTALNPDISVYPYRERLNTANALDIITGYDVVVDATDNFAARYLINDACVMLGKPFVYGAVQHFEGHVSVFNHAGGPTYRCLFPTPPGAGEIPDCNSAGVLGVVPGMIGCRQALEVVKLITGIGESLSGYLQVYDFLRDEQFRIRLTAVQANLRIDHLQESYEAPACTAPGRLLQPSELRQLLDRGEDCFLIDVRDPAEFSAGHLPGAVNMPLAALGEMDVESMGRRVVLHCQQGGRSAAAFRLLSARYPHLAMHELAGGLDNWNKIYSRV